MKTEAEIRAAFEGFDASAKTSTDQEHKRLAAYFATALRWVLGDDPFIDDLIRTYTVGRN